jgi:hypothetical protein
MYYNTKYEELTDFGLYPEQDLLEAFINVKLSYGYSGDLCSNGSFEYVRFFIDWNNNGNYLDPDEDMGITRVNVHDIPNTPTNCLSNTKPLTYSVYLKIDPDKWFCETPQLVKVRAILSWQHEPTAGDPSYIPVWGNVVDKWVQIAPRPKLMILDKYQLLDEYLLDPYIIKNVPSELPEKPKLYPEDLKKIYATEPVSEFRFSFPKIAQEIGGAQNSKMMDSVQKYQSDYLIALSNTGFEELNTVGLNYDTDELAAQITVKLPSGYSGDLCTDGSMEYVAFWLYIWDEEMNRCFWHYVGTGTVNVHDISTIPPEGLEYALRLPANLGSLKDECSNPVVIKIRGVLSWNYPPSTTNPHAIPWWGNRVDRIIQIKPGENTDGLSIPFISVVGGMAVSSISGNIHSTVPSSIGPGYANGPFVYGGTPANESPFGATVTICGHISNPPNDPPNDSAKIRYKVQYKKVGLGTDWHDLENTFKIWISTWNGFTWTMSSKYQTPSGGWYVYEEDLTPPIQKFVEGNVFGQWATKTAIEGDGLYEIKVIAFNPLTGFSTSNIVSVMIDNTRPDPDISLDMGACSLFNVGDTITGDFTALDDHIWRYSFELLPKPESNSMTITPQSLTYPALIPPGVVTEPFTITTGSTPACGYVVLLHVRDRTIRNNHFNGNYNKASVGFCLLD